VTAPADGRGGSTPPRTAAADDGQPRQCFVIRPWLFVTAAIGLLSAAPRPPQPLPVLPWSSACGLTPDPGSGPRSVTLIGPGPGFDPAHAMTTGPGTTR
jgi:hypothetical protein